MRRFQAAQGSLTYDPKGSQQKDQRMSLDDPVVSSQHMLYQHFMAYQEAG